MPSRRRHLAIALSAALGFGLGWASVQGSAAIARAACVPEEACCKVCTRGVACGDTCISRDKTCHKGRGCACNAWEICSR